MTYRGNLPREGNSKQFAYSYEAGSKGGSGIGTLDRKDCNYVARSYSEGGSVKK